MTPTVTRGRGPKNPQRILLVEDNVLNMELARDLLTAAGYLVFEAETAEAALLLAPTTHPDLVLMDIRLPGMDGLAAARELRSDPGTRSIPVVVLSAQAMRQDQDAARAAGCAGFITKPIDTRTFLGEVMRHLPAPGSAPATVTAPASPSAERSHQ